MAPIPIIAPTIVRTTMHHDMTNGRRADCVIDVSLDMEITTEDRDEVAEECARQVTIQWQDNMCPMINSPISFTGSSWVDLDSMESRAGEFAPQAGHPINATPTVELPAPNTAVLIRKMCGHSRAQRTGRMYVPGIKEAFVDSKGAFGPGGSYFTSWQNAANGLLSDINSISGTITGTSIAMRVVHVTGHEPAPPGQSTGRPNSWNSTDVDALLVDPVVATQRRRLRG